MLKKHYSLVVAEHIINKFINHQKFDHSKIDGFIESYQNGREHGLIIWIPVRYENEKRMGDVAYYICQHRRSDSICIYKGPYVFSSISEEAYKHPNFFNEGNYDGAVNFLLTEFGMV